jgi:hypothetical protein
VCVGSRLTKEATMGRKTDSREWVATDTWLDERQGGDVLYEAGGVYPTKPRCKFAENARPLAPGEYTATCPGCGQRFVGIDGSSAEENRDLHVTGDADAPSICPAKAATC